MDFIYQVLCSLLLIPILILIIINYDTNHSD